MQRQIKRSLTFSFWLSILLHLLLLIGLIISFFLRPVQRQDKPPTDYVPAYTYTGSAPPPPAATSAARRTTSSSNLPLSQTTKADFSSKPIPSKQNTYPQDKTSSNKQVRPQSSIFASSMQVLAQQQQKALQAEQDEEPIYLIGDMSQAADPLIKLIGKALSAHFRYPETAGRLGIKGRALIGFTLHPQGYFTNVQLLSSSFNHDLDSAALYAVNTAPTIVGADRFLSRPKHFVVGFIFY